MVDLYSVLGVDRTATTEQIKNAFKKIAFDNHPDRFPGDAIKGQTFKNASHAFHILTDVSKREKYDRLLHEKEQKQKHSVSDIFDDESDVTKKYTVGDFLGSVVGSEFFDEIANRIAYADSKKHSAFKGVVIAGKIFVGNRMPNREEIKTLIDGGSAFADLMSDLACGPSGRGGDGT